MGGARTAFKKTYNQRISAFDKIHQSTHNSLQNRFVDLHQILEGSHNLSYLLTVPHQYLLSLFSDLLLG